MENIVELFCFVDDFCQAFRPQWNRHLMETGMKQRHRSSRLTDSEIITLVILFHPQGFRHFKGFYQQVVEAQLKSYFPGLVSYTRFTALLKSALVPFCVLRQRFSGQKTGIYFADSMILKVCHIKREKQHRVFKGLAAKSKSSMGWFYGFKLHLVINDRGEIMAVRLTAVNVDDRQPVPQLTQHLRGKLFGDKGYISEPLSSALFQKGLQLITRVRKNMKNKLISMADKLLLRRRGLIESVNDQLKNICQIEHSRHRSPWSFAVNIVSVLIAYWLKPKNLRLI